jgi:hypothetical protein
MPRKPCKPTSKLLQSNSSPQGKNRARGARTRLKTPYRADTKPAEEREFKMNEIELKPCPFCGGEAEAIVFHLGCNITCELCQLISPAFHSNAEAVGWWNNRPNEVEELDDTRLSKMFEVPKLCCFNCGDPTVTEKDGIYINDEPALVCDSCWMEMEDKQNENTQF